MNIFPILIGLLFCGAALLGVIVVFVGCIVACVKRNWKIAAWSVVGTISVLGGMVGVFSLLFWQSDYYVRNPVASDAVTGTYHLDSRWAQGRLLQMGYKRSTGQITLNPDGGFTATEVPACCIHGWDETSWPFSGGYYSLSGTWKVAKSSGFNATNYVVRLELSTAQISDQPPTNGKIFKENRDAPRELEINLIKGTPLSLGFKIFNGDFDDVLFLKSN